MNNQFVLNRMSRDLADKASINKYILDVHKQLIMNELMNQWMDELYNNCLRAIK